MKFEELKTGDIFVLDGVMYMRTDNNTDSYDNAIILYGNCKGVLVNFYYNDEVDFVERSF